MIKKINISINIFWYTMLTSGIINAINVMMTLPYTINAGEAITIDIQIDNTDLFVAFQVDIPIPANLVFQQGSTTANPLRFTEGHILSDTLLEGNILRIMGYSMDNSAFNGVSGAMVSFVVTTGTVPGLIPLELNNAVIGDASASNILTSVVNGSVTITAPDIQVSSTSINFDETPLLQYTDRPIQIVNNFL